MKHSLLFCWVFMLGFTGSFAVNSQTISLLPSKDNTIYSEGDSSNGKGLYFFTGINNKGFERRALIRFDLSAFTSPDSVISAQLQLFLSKTKVGTRTVYIYRLIHDWGESGSVAPYEEGGGTGAFPGDATWNYAFYDTVTWTTPGGDFNPVPSDSTMVNDTGPYTWSGDGLLTDVKYWIENPGFNFGWILVIHGSQNSTKRFNSSENTDNPPMLVLQTPAQQSSALQITRVNNFIVFPNPTHGDIFIRNIGSWQISRLQIADMTGRIILTIPKTDLKQDVKELHLPQKGIYFLVINNTIYRKVVVY